MNTVFVIVIVALVAMVVVSLVKGIVAFLQSSREDLERDPQSGATEMQLRQNKAMFARVKYQALAVVVIGLLLAFGRS